MPTEAWLDRVRRKARAKTDLRQMEMSMAGLGHSQVAPSSMLRRLRHPPRPFHVRCADDSSGTERLVAIRRRMGP